MTRRSASPRRAPLALATVAAALLIFAPSAFALETHDFSTSFGEPGSGDGQLSLANQSGVAVNDETGDVYVADTGNNRVVEFSKAGAFIRAFGADVGGPGVNVCASGCKAGTPGSAPGQLTEPTSIAIDNAPGGEKGDVYVADSSPSGPLITRFTSAGALISSWGQGGQLSASTATATGTLTEGSTTISSLTASIGAFFEGEPISGEGIPAETTITACSPSCEAPTSLEISQSVEAGKSATREISARAAFGTIYGLAVDPEGHLWAYGALPNGEMFEFAPSSESLRGWRSHTEPTFAGIATDSAGNVYLHPEGGDAVLQFTPAGVEVGPVNQSPEGVGLEGLAIDPANNDLYTRNVAQLLAGEQAGQEAFFSHYPASCDPGGDCPAADSFGFEALTRFGTGLAVDPATHAVYAADASLSHIDVFAGPTIVPEPTTEAPTAVGLQTATLNGHLDPAGGPQVTSCAFQYVTAQAFEQGTEGTPQGLYRSNSAYSDLSSGGTVPCAEGNTFSAPASVHADLTDLTGASYFYRLVVTNAAGHRRLGATQSFTLLPDHAFAATFAGSGADALSDPTALAVDEASHDVWVTDPANHRVEKFTPSGEFLLMIGKGVNKQRSGTAADLCTAAEECQPGLSASSPGGFGDPNQLAVDNSSGPSAGDLYVADDGDAIVSKFDQNGHLIASWGDHHGAHEPPKGQLDGSSDQNSAGPFNPERGFIGIAVGPAGDLWVGAKASHNVGTEATDLFEFDSSGHWLQSFPSPSGNGVAAAAPAGIAVDPAGRLYSAFGGQGGVLRFTSANREEIHFGVPGFPPLTGLTVNSVGEPYVDTGGSTITHFTSRGEAGASFGSPQLEGAQGLALDSTNEDIFAANTVAGDVALFTGFGPHATTGPVESPGHTSATLTGTVDPIGRGDVESCRFQYVTQAAYEKTEFFDLSSGGTAPCDQSTPIAAKAKVTGTVTGLQTETTYRYRLLAENSQKTAYGQILSFTPHAVLDLKTEAATEVENRSATLNGSFTADEHATEYFFQYGTSTHYGYEAPVPPGEVPASATGSRHLEAHLTELVPGTTYHYRLIAHNSLGTTTGEDETLTTAQPPTIESFSTSEVTATSAVLHARINPQGFDTGYHFEYGTTTAYGQSAPEPEGQITESLSQGQAVEVHLEGLQRGATYHFRVVATNKWGETTSDDQSFEFFPPSCPNSAVRQQTSSAYLPDCRAYELVSPGNANGTLLYSAGPTSPYATSPSRFAYTGAFSSPPEATETIGTDGDLYLATRTDTGWASHYVGLPGTQTGCMGGPPTNPESHTTHAEKIQDHVFADLSLSRVLDFNLGNGADCYLSGNGTSDATQQLDLPSNAPYLWSSEGALLAHLPSNLSSTPAAAAALACPVSISSLGHQAYCSGEVSASPDLTHLLFSSNNLSFAEPGRPPGLILAPGSAYDDNLATGKLTLISTLPGGGPILQDPSYAASEPRCGGFTVQEGPPQCPSEEFLRFPAVSTDGSHVLISTATAGTEWCGRDNDKVVCPRFTDNPIHIYMSIEDRPAVEIAENQTTHEPAPVHYLGISADGSKVFFTSEEHLTEGVPGEENPGHGGASLYMWSQKGEEEVPSHPLTLISKAAPGSSPTAGDTESCSPSLVNDYDDTGRFLGTSPWTTKCGVVPYSGWSYANAQGDLGGNGASDTAIASKSGDVYFYSPEQLDGARGVPGQQNLYVYRGGSVHYVTTLGPEKACQVTQFTAEASATSCADSPIARLQVTPDGAHMAFVTESRLTPYDNAGHLEMYSFTPATGNLVCDSCNPSGKPATADVYASQNGLFLTEDGRTFFSTTESLVPQDTNQGEDVYEFVDGRPQLITPGTGTATGSELSQEAVPGLIGVSADGTDVYFSTFNVLLSEDHNGNFFKFYDARTNGGFPQPPPVQPCAAAEECHGPGTEAPALPTQGTAASLAGGNATPGSHKHHKRAKKRHHKRAAHHHRRAGK